MQGKKSGKSVIWGPWRDPGAPREPKTADAGAGLMEWDDSIRNLQLGEGAEEVVWVEDGQLLLPEEVKGTPVEDRVLSEYHEVASDDSTPVPGGLDVRYVDSEIVVPEGLEVWDLGGYRTGVEPEGEGTEDQSYELLNFLEMDLPSNASPFDLEHWYEGEELVHPDRPVYEIDVETGETVLYESGEEVYEGDIEGAIEYLGEEWGEEMPRPAATVKVQGAVQSFDSVDEKVEEYFLG